jgi:glucokinase
MRRLIGDIGGTNARFAIATDGAYASLQTLVGEEYPTFEQAIETYIAGLPVGERPEEAAFAIAGPVSGERVRFTNHAWSFAKSELKARFGFVRLVVVNDFTANALSLPYLADDDLQQVGTGTRDPAAPIGILGPGTGLGVSGLVRTPEGGWVALEGEGGHGSMAPADPRESAVIEALRLRFGHVSAERVLSGDGLVNLYDTLCQLDGVPSQGFKAAQITDEAMGIAHSHCKEAVAMFCAMLGSVAGNLALTLGARGGIFIAGGIVPRLGARFARSRFRERFEAKGRFQSYLAPIATLLITHKTPALVGLARLL